MLTTLKVNIKILTFLLKQKWMAKLPSLTLSDYWENSTCVTDVCRKKPLLTFTL